MGGLWVDYNLMTTIDGLYAIGEANFSDHGANRLGASALMQGSRRLLHPAYTNGGLPGAGEAHQSGPRGSGVPSGPGRSERARPAAARRERPQDRGRVPTESWVRVMWDTADVAHAADWKRRMARIGTLRDEF